MPYQMWLGAFYGVSEVLIALVMRSKDGVPVDRGSLRLIWRVIGLSVLSAVLAVNFLPFAALDGETLQIAGISVYVLGLGLRWWSIVYLGRFFTVDVAIAKDHREVDSGPYRFIRHPSYTGALLAFLGYGLTLANWLSLLVLIVPITSVFLYRIRIEERALLDGLGDAYAHYMQRTKRLVPFVV